MTTSHSPLASHPPPSPSIFTSWLRSRGVVQHSPIDLRLATDGSGYGVWSTDDIARGEILCAIPRQSILSARTSSLQRSYEPESAADIILHLTACLLHELRLGEESEFYGWLQMIPRETVLLPTLWDEASVAGEDGRRALEWLEGTEALKQLERKDGEGLSLDVLRQYHSSLDLPSTPHHPDQSPFPTFLNAYSMVSSRGFALDTYHLIGLIPFCDMFNHSSSSPYTSLSIDANVCEHCGSLLVCEHDEADSDRLEGMSAGYLAKLQADGVADMVDMRVQRDVKKDEQVFSCYDEDHGDAELLAEYGFTEGGNTAVTWSYRDFLDPERPEIAQRFMSLVGRNTGSDEIVDDGNRSSAPLIGPAHPSQYQPEPLVIRSNGEMSRNLFTIIYNETTFDVDSNVEERAVDLDRIIRSLNHGKSIDKSPSDLEIVNRVCELIGKRLATFHKAGLTLDELNINVKELTDEHVLERLAAQYLLSERNLLEYCLGRWRAIE